MDWLPKITPIGPICARIPAVANIMPSAVGKRNLNLAEYRRVEVVVYEALKKLAKRGVVEQTGQGAKAARWIIRA